MISSIVSAFGFGASPSARKAEVPGAIRAWSRSATIRAAGYVGPVITSYRYTRKRQDTKPPFFVPSCLVLSWCLLTQRHEVVITQLWIPFRTAAFGYEIEQVPKRPDQIDVASILA